jgi:prolyl oligopeptidase
MSRPEIVETLFGVEVRDPYRWLEDFDDPEVQSWVEQQDRLSRKLLDALPERESIARRLAELLYVEQRSVPVRRTLPDGTARYFLSIKPADKEKAIHYTKDGKDGPLRVLLDPNTMSEDGSLSIGGVYPSLDGRWVGYLEKPNNADNSNIVVLEVDTRRVHDGDTIRDVRHTAPSWTPDASGFYYTWTPSDAGVSPEERLAHAEVRFHALGTDPKRDDVVHPATGDASKLLGAFVSRDGKYVFAYVRSGWVRDDVYIQFTERADGKWHPFATGEEAVYSIEVHGGSIYVMTNSGAPRFRVFRVSPEKLAREHWKEIVPEHPSSVIESIDIVGGHLVLGRLERAYSHVEVRELDGGLVRHVDLPGIGVASTLVGEPDHDDAYFTFSSPTHPPEIYETSVAKGGRRLDSRVELPLTPDDFEVKQVHYPSKDGASISMFIVHRKGLVLDGKNPTRLYGYGGFSISMSPGFFASIFPWLERGGVFAMPNLRGGSEYGEDWHRAGMLDKKQNVFDDFIAAAEYLIAEKYTRPRSLAISGGSNGGLLVGAAMTQRPELFEAVICAVPVLDMLRYHTVGLGKVWIPEYGDPDNPEHFPFLLAYSPYHRVTPGVRYPSLLVLGADTDDRVDPMHARKFTAAVQAASSHPDPKALLRIERNAGHTGADLRREAIARLADEYAFLWDRLTRPGE